MSNQERLQKIISQAGIASRRKAEELISNKLVKVNGKIAKLGDKASFADEIIVDGIPILKEEKVYYIINKPRKTLTTLSDPKGRSIITDYINVPEYIFPVGRLDWNTTGTLFLTNDGDLANKLAHPSFEVKRVYRARLDAPLSKQDLEFLNSNNVKINNKISKQEVKSVDNKSYLVILSQGSYHHVKKLFELVNKTVRSLNRIEYAGISHIGLKEGEYRKLKPKEIKWLKQLVNK